MAEQTPCRSTGHRTSQRLGRSQPHSTQERGFFMGVSGVQLQDLLQPLQVVLIVDVDLPERR